MSGRKMVVIFGGCFREGLVSGVKGCSREGAGCEKVTEQKMLQEWLITEKIRRPSIAK